LHKSFPCTTDRGSVGECSLLFFIVDSGVVDLREGKEGMVRAGVELFLGDIFVVETGFRVPTIASSGFSVQFATIFPYDMRQRGFISLGNTEGVHVVTSSTWQVFAGLGEEVILRTVYPRYTGKRESTESGEGEAWY
jgi:hypothetical protein